jgi:anti-sigma-K factor RskA
VAAALVIALAAFGLGRVTAGGEGTGGGRTVDLPALDSGSGSGTAEIAADGAGMTVRLADLPASESGEFYELWLLNSPDDLISVGSIQVPASGEVEVTLPVPLPPERYRFLDLSIEPADGNPAHSGQSVLRGATA